jgi:hypothetical protein
MYRQAADHLLHSLLTGNFNRTSAQPSKAALKAEASAAAAAAAAAAGAGVQQQQQQQGSGQDEVLPARKALMDDLEVQFEAGLRPKYTWLVIKGDQLLLDLMSGSYLWLKPVHAAAAAAANADAAAAGVIESAETAVQSATASTTAAAGAAAAALPEMPAAARRRGRPRKSSSSSSSSSWRVTEELESLDSSSSRGECLLALDSNAVDLSSTAAIAVSYSKRAAAAAASKRLDASVLYELLLELPDSSMHVISSPSTATSLLAEYATDRTAAAVAPDSSSSSSSGGAKPLPLPAALARAERLAALLVSQQHAFLGREAAVRLAGMVGGWKVPSKASEQQPVMPASERVAVCCSVVCLLCRALPVNDCHSCGLA